jgi:pyruvate-formate lyase-activating enzyme
MLISCIAHLKNQGKEWRNLKIYGQEINQLTSAIGRMNLFLHGIDDFHIANDDTLKSPAFIEKGTIQQFDLVLALLEQAKAQGLHTAIETCGYTIRDLTRLHPVTDLWLYDIKLLDDAAHRCYTGVSNRQILKNLRLLDALGANIVLRCPIIPGVNLTEAHFGALAVLVNSLQNVQAIHLEPYHPLGISKAQQLGRVQTFGRDAFLTPEEIMPFAQQLQKNVQIEVMIT